MQYARNTNNNIVHQFAIIFNFYIKWHKTNSFSLCVCDYCFLICARTKYCYRYYWWHLLIASLLTLLLLVLDVVVVYWLLKCCSATAVASISHYCEAYTHTQLLVPSTSNNIICMHKSKVHCVVSYEIIFVKQLSLCPFGIYGYR